jgi:hypothetical protein
MYIIRMLISYFNYNITFLFIYLYSIKNHFHIYMCKCVNVCTLITIAVYYITNGLSEQSTISLSSHK